MEVFKRLSKEEALLKDRRKDSVERRRRQHEIEEERRKRMRTLRPDLDPHCLW
jgi:hypothetical protein